MVTWLLPGMDATGLLWGPLVAALGRRHDVRPWSYPPDVTRYEHVIAHLGAPPPGTVLVAESFSGPAAIRIAHAHADRVRALVLVASFARGTRAPLALGRLLEAVIAIRPPSLALRALMVGLDAPDALVSRVREALAEVPAATMLARVRAAASVDVRAELGRLPAPMPIVWIRARRDRLVSARATEDAREARPALDVRVIDGPHLLAQARPGAIAEIVRAAAS